MQSEFHIDVWISFKESVLDPQGQVVKQALHHLGIEGVQSARVGKWIQLQVFAEDDTQAKAMAVSACEKLLVNQVIEKYTLQVKQVGQ